MSKCNSLFQDKQETSMREKWDYYVRLCEDEEKRPMEFNEWVADYADELTEREKYAKD